MLSERELVTMRAGQKQADMRAMIEESLKTMERRIAETRASMSEGWTVYSSSLMSVIDEAARTMATIEAMNQSDEAFRGALRAVDNDAKRGL